MARAEGPRIGVLTSPGAASSQSALRRPPHEVALRAVARCGLTPVPLWEAGVSRDGVNGVKDVDAVILPGDSAGDSAGAAPVLGDLVARARKGLPVLGTGSGFGILCEAGLLPGELVRNASGRFLCADQTLRIETNDTVWTSACRPGEIVTLVLRQGAGRFRADPETLRRLESENQVVFRYAGGNPTGSADDIAGVTNAAGNVVGLIAQPEYTVDELTGPGVDGRRLFASVESFLGRFS